MGVCQICGASYGINMDFLKSCDRIELLKDKRYRAILRKIKEYEEE